MRDTALELTRNIGIMAHIDAGKFHTGGVASSEDITQGLPRGKEYCHLHGRGIRPKSIRWETVSKE